MSLQWIKVSTLDISVHIGIKSPHWIKVSHWIKMCAMN